MTTKSARVTLRKEKKASYPEWSESHIFKIGLYSYPHTLVIVFIQEVSEREVFLSEMATLVTKLPYEGVWTRRG